MLHVLLGPYHLDGKIPLLSSAESMYSDSNERKMLICSHLGFISSLILLTDLNFVLMAGSSEKNAEISD